MPTWITPAGLLATIVPGNASNVSLQCNTANSFITYSIISGSLPPGFDLSGPTSFPQLPYPTLWGTADVSGVGQHKLTQYGQRFLEALVSDKRDN